MQEYKKKCQFELMKLTPIRNGRNLGILKTEQMPFDGSQPLSPHTPTIKPEIKDPDIDEAHLSQTVPGPIGPGPHFSTHLPSLYLPTIPHCRQMRCP